MQRPARDRSGPGVWRLFQPMEVYLAYEHARLGGVAVHLNLDNETFRYRGHRTAHLLCQPLEELHAAAAALGMKRCWYQHRKTPRHRHYDLFGEPLRAAIRNCGGDPAVILGESDQLDLLAAPATLEDQVALDPDEALEALDKMAPAGGGS